MHGVLIGVCCLYSYRTTIPEAKEALDKGNEELSTLVYSSKMVYTHARIHTVSTRSFKYGIFRIYVIKFYCIH